MQPSPNHRANKKPNLQRLPTPDDLINQNNNKIQLRKTQSSPSLSNQKDTESNQKDTKSNQKDTKSNQKDTKSNQKDLASKNIETIKRGNTKDHRKNRENTKNDGKTSKNTIKNGGNPNSNGKNLIQSEGGVNFRAKENEKRRILQEFREKLPIYSVRDKLIEEIKCNPSLILIGETGSGKTTQIPQFIYQSLTNQEKHNRCPKYKFKAIAITQPRRIAAIGVAARVAEEMGVPLGDLVGYHVRFDKKMGQNTKILFLTDGMLLREAMLDPWLSDYHTVVLDEAHERSLETDILFALLVDLQKKRAEGNIRSGGKNLPPLKLIIMSATLDAELFEKYFNAKVIYVKGRQYPVKIYYTPTPERNYIDAALITTLQIHLDEGPGDILVFLTGRYEIESLDKLLKSRAKLLPPSALKLITCPLFGALTPSHQQRVFELTPEGTRKIVIATNIAETSITVPNIKYVIDSGMVKARTFVPKLGLDILSVLPISQAQARQRAGRAGRTQPGICFRLYTEKDFLKLQQTFLPDILRVNLASTILTLKAIGIENVIEFNYMERPPLDSFRRALSDLWLVGALAPNGSLSDIGKKMAMFPLEPLYSKALIQSVTCECSKEVIAIISMLSTENILLTPSSEAKEDDISTTQKIFSGFTSPYGDHLMLLRIFDAYCAESNKKEWCKLNFLNHKAMKKVIDIHRQITEYWLDLGWELVSSKPRDGGDISYDAVRKCFASAFFSRMAVCQPDGSYVTQLDNKRVYIHPSSCLFQKKPEIVIYNELVMTSKEYMRDLLKIEREWFLDLQPQLVKARNREIN